MPPLSATFSQFLHFYRFLSSSPSLKNPVNLFFFFFFPPQGKLISLLEEREEEEEKEKHREECVRDSLKSPIAFFYCSSFSSSNRHNSLSTAGDTAAATDGYQLSQLSWN